MTLTLQESIDRLQANEDRLDQFVNDPAGTGSYATRDGQPVPTVPVLVEEVRQAASALGNPDGAANVGYTPAAGDPTDVQTALRTLQSAGSVADHEAKPDPHPQYAKAEALAGHALAANPHPQYATLAQLHAAALSF